MADYKDLVRKEMYFFYKSVLVVLLQLKSLWYCNLELLELDKVTLSMISK